MSTASTVTASVASVEVTACAASFSPAEDLDAQVVPERKRSVWDHCSPATDSGFPHFDFHENSHRWPGDT